MSWNFENLTLPSTIWPVVFENNVGRAEMKQIIIGLKIGVNQLLELSLLFDFLVSEENVYINDCTVYSHVNFNSLPF